MKKEDHDIRHQRLPHEAHAHLPRRPSHDEFVHNVVRLIIASMPARRHGVAEIASSLSLGEQTFRRHIFAATGLARKISSRVCRCARPQGCSSIVRMFGSGMWVAAVDSMTRAHSPTPLRNVMAWGRDNFATYTTMKQNNKRTEAKSGRKMYKQLCFSLKS